MIQGFTLIEVLLAMTLMSIMMVLLFASLKICAQSWEQGEKKINEVNDVAAVVNFFQRHLIIAKPLWNDFTKEERMFAFQGKKQAVQFVSAFPASAGRTGLQLISVALQREHREQVLQVTLTPFFPLTDDEAWSEEKEVLITGVRDFSLAYFGPEDGQTENRWQDEWLERDRQPKLVKIRIDLENEIFWPEMIFDLKIASSVDNTGVAADNSGSEDASDSARDGSVRGRSN
jgi:general secretion pathway protein J